jgi:hypothetical protein
MTTGSKALLIGSGTVIAVVLVIGLVVAGLLVVGRVGGKHPVAGGSTVSGSVVFDDNFSSDRGWDVAPVSGFTTDLHLGNPGSMHLAVPGQDAGFHELYPGSSYSRVKFSATLANRTGTGDVGLICDDPNSSGRYRFWAGSNGTAFIDVSNGPGTNPTVLAQTDRPKWAAGETHTLTAVCSSDGKNVTLQFLIDGQSVLQASDTTTTGPFTPGLLVQGPVTVDLHRFVVSTL